MINGYKTCEELGVEALCYDCYRRITWGYGINSINSIEYCYIASYAKKIKEMISDGMTIVQIIEWVRTWRQEYLLEAAKQENVELYNKLCKMKLLS